MKLSTFDDEEITVTLRSTTGRANEGNPYALQPPEYYRELARTHDTPGVRHKVPIRRVSILMRLTESERQLLYDWAATKHGTRVVKVMRDTLVRIALDEAAKQAKR